MMANEDETIEPKDHFLAADSFFPIFVFVISQCNLKKLDLYKMSMWGLCTKDSLSGEGGYYLTVFEAALEYFASFEIPSE